MTRKILIIISRFVPAPGGAQRYVYDLARCLSSMNYAITVVSTDYWLVGPRLNKRIPTAEMFSHDANAPFSIVRLSPRTVRGFPIMFGVGCVKYLRDVNVVHINESLDGLPYYFPVFFAARIRRKKIVVTVHIIYRNRRNLFSRIGNLAGGLVLNLCDTVAVPSKADFTLLSRLPIDTRKIVNIPPGIEAPSTWGLQYPNSPPNSRAFIRILTVASLTEIKGIDDSIRAISMLSNQFDIQYLVVGPDVGYGKVLAGLTSELGLGKRVFFVGQIDNRERLKQIYLDTDIVVIPSRYESGPITLLEAMASAKPIVATKVGIIPEIIVNGLTGILVEPSSPKALADAIQNLISDEGLRNSLGQRAKETVQKYDIQALAKVYTRLYESQ